jgi:hypothetical protein
MCCASDGKYIVVADKRTKNPNDEYSGYDWAGEKIWVFSKSSDAIAKLKEVVASEGYEAGREYDIEVS